MGDIVLEVDTAYMEDVHPPETVESYVYKAAPGFIQFISDHTQDIEWFIGIVVALWGKYKATSKVPTRLKMKIRNSDIDLKVKFVEHQDNDNIEDIIQLIRDEIKESKNK